MQETAHNWQSKAVSNYQQTIRQKICGYDYIYSMMCDILKTFTPMERMLIVGAGGGQELLTIGTENPTIVFTAVDTSQQMLQIALDRTKRLNEQLTIHWHCKDLQAIEFHETFDAATCHLVLHFIENEGEKLQLLTKIAQSLPKGAPLFLSCINADVNDPSFKQQLAYWKSSMLKNGVLEEEWERFEQSFHSTTHPISYERLVDLLKQAGFTQVVRYYKTYLIDCCVVLK